MAFLRQNKSKWEVVDDGGRRVYRAFKNRKDAEEYLEYCKAWSEAANLRDLTARQKELIDRQRVREGKSPLLWNSEYP